MLGECGGPFWTGDDFNHCFWDDVLRTLLPLIICAVSVLHISILAAHHVWVSRREYEDSPRIDSDVGGKHYDPPDSEHGGINNFMSCQHPETSSCMKHESTMAVGYSRGVSGLEVIEGIAVVAELILSGVALHPHVSHINLASIAILIQWTYVLFLVTVSLASAKWVSPSHRLLKQHRAVLYAFSWIISVLLLRSVLIHPQSRRSLTLQIFDWFLISLLLLLSIGSSNKAQESQLYSENQPREPVASLFSLATFMWVDPIIWKGYRKVLEAWDVWDLPPAGKAARVLVKFRRSRKYTRLAVHLLIHHSQDLLVQGLWAICSAVFTFAPTLLIKLLLEYLEASSTSSASTAWLYVTLLFVSSFLKAVAEGQASWLGKKVAIHLRAIVVGEIFSKTLKRKFTTNAMSIEKEKGGEVKDDKHPATSNVDGNGKNQQATTGNVTNLMAVDSVKIANATSFLHLLWASVPAELVIGIALLYNILGYASIAGLAIMVVLMPIKIIIARSFSKVQARIMRATDARIQTTNELFQNIRTIKYLAYEDRFIYDVHKKRSTELQELRYRFILWTLAVTVYNTTPVLITFFTFLIYTVVEHRDLRPSVAFPALSLFALLRIPLDKLAETLASVQEALVSVNRVQSYLDEDETDKYRQIAESGMDNGAKMMGFQDASFTWVEGDPGAFCMRGVNTSFVPDGLNIIIGPTGSGKTSLMLALIGEMDLLGGKIDLPKDVRPKTPVHGSLRITKSVAYCAQRAWLVNDSIKQNILFGSYWDPERYKAVVAACALKPDLQLLPAGDNTRIGDKGIKLSGGQKQRVALARAVYSKARYVLLDDSLSAVDSHTGQWIVDHCITGVLMRNRTCILITHNVALTMRHARQVVVLSDGKVVAQGSPDAITSSGILHDQHVQSGLTVGSQPSTSDGSYSTAKTPPSVHEVEEVGHNTAWEGNETEHVHSVEDMEAVSTVTEHPGLESKATGAITWDLFRLYFTASGRWYYWLAMSLMFFANQLSSLSIDLWIREWSNSYQGEKVTTADMSQGFLDSRRKDLTLLTQDRFSVDSMSQKSAWYNLYSIVTTRVDTRYYLGIYAILATIFMVIKAIRMGLLFRGSLSASRNLHNQLLASITRASFHFYDATPFGQMVNRFSRDVEVVDQELAPVMLGFQHAAFSALTIWILISVATPLFIVPGIFVALSYFLIGKLYINSSRDLKRIESLQRSPLYQQLDEMLAGIVTIRAYGHETRFLQDATALLDNHSRAFLYLWATNAWLALRIDVASALISFLAGAFVVMRAGKINPGTAGLSLTYAITFTEHVLWLVRLYAVNEQNMNSVERIKEYIDIDPEAPTEIPETKPPANWPSEGSIEFVHYSTRYRDDLPFALKDITLTIQPGDKIAIVGRTGAGKTSLTAALFRGLEATEGKILIDGIDISTIGLHDLRRSVTIVPQDPTVFTGTLRSNLDPLELRTDEEILAVLRLVRLVQSPTSAPTQQHDGLSSSSSSLLLPLLNTPIPPSSSSSSSNSPFSLGQHQLICLARALLRRPTILIMDEATASIDHATDEHLQSVVMDLGCTVITIAHRLKTIMEYERVVVLDGGAVVEGGGVRELMGRGRVGSVFAGMVGEEEGGKGKGKGKEVLGLVRE